MPRHLMTLGAALGAVLGATLGRPALAQAPSAMATAAAETPKTPLPAKTLIDQAVATAKANNKTVLVHVGASWCGWCHKFDQMLASKDVGPIIEAHYVLVALDGMEEGPKKSLENPGVDSVMKALGLPAGPPVYAFLDATGAEIANSQVMPNNGGIGYPAIPAEIQAFDALLKKTAPRMTDAEHATITEYLTRNAPKEQ